MRILATSDIHTHYAKNKNWLIGLSDADYQQDVLILAGDITHDLEELRKAFEIVRPKFAEVLFVPGNHDLWLSPKDEGLNSIDKFHRIMEFATAHGIQTEPLHFDTFSIIPLFSWYDYSFGKPSEFIMQKWQDFRFCKWPESYDMVQVTDYFLSLNEEYLKHEYKHSVISFSHFLPRTDIMPSYISDNVKRLFPVFGSHKIEEQIKKLKASIHIYGHSHLNLQVKKGNITYINNAFGYPHEKGISQKRIISVYET